MIGWFIKKYGPKKLLLASGDLLCSLISAFLALYLTSKNGLIYFQDNTFIEKILIFAFGAFFTIPVFRYYQLYKHKYFLNVGEQILLILKGLLITNIAIILLIFLVKTQETLHDSRAQVIVYFLIAFSSISFVRILIFRPALSSKNYLGSNINRFLTRRAIAIGAGGLGQFFSESLLMKDYYHI